MSSRAWLRAKILETYDDGERLVAEAAKRGNGKHTYLVEQLRRRGATDMVEEYLRQCREESDTRHWGKKEERLKEVEAVLGKPLPEPQRRVLEKELASLRKAFAKREKETDK